MNTYYVYILSNKHRTTLYIGVTNDLRKRTSQHQDGTGSAFTNKYLTADLLYYETFHEIKDAIAREKQLKNWKRDWKIELITTINPTLKTITDELW
jgi:putative endonuclease